MGRNQSAMIVAFTSLEKAAKGMNLFINEEKTKYMPVTKKSHASYPHYLPYKFQVAQCFTYLGSDVNCKNYIVAEIQKTYSSRKQMFFCGLKKHLRSNLTSK
jgi:hypothetical protein